MTKEKAMLDKVPMAKAHGLVKVFLQAGVTEAQLSADSGVSPSSIYRIARKQGRNVQKDIYDLLEHYFNRLMKEDAVFSSAVAGLGAQAKAKDIEASTQVGAESGPKAAPLAVDAKPITERLKLIADHFGFDAQAEKLIEEMAELIVAIKHLKKRDGNEADHLANFVEELADVKIMVDQLVYLNDKAAPEDYSVRSEIEFKVNRTMQRIEEQKRAAEAGDYSGIAVTLTADKVAEAEGAASVAIHK